LKAIGLLSGKIPLQVIDTLEGFLDLISGKTGDIRRLAFTESALK